VIAENNDPADAYLKQGFHGVVFRNVTGKALVDCVRSSSRRRNLACLRRLRCPKLPKKTGWVCDVCDRLTPKEMRIVALIVQGAKTGIANRLNTTEQVIQEHLRSIYGQDRCERPARLALFTIHHRVRPLPPPTWQQAGS